MAKLSFQQVRKDYHGQAIIHGMDLDVADGEFIVIVGPSGCGKSTLLRMLAGLESISAGTITIDGAVVNGLEPAQRDIAMVFQNYALYPHMTVYDNMAYGLKIRGLPVDEIRRRVAEAARILSLEPLLTRRPRQLSGGQRQRVAMGRAIVRAPKVFLFDEPLSNLDAKLRVQMRLELQKLHRRLATTSLYVTHDQVEAMTLAHRMVVMNQGVAEQIGTPAEIYERPASTFVAGFIGAPPMNLLDVNTDGLQSACLKDGQPCFTAAPPLPAGNVSMLGIRPEHLQPGPPPSNVRALHLQTTVDTVEALGAEHLLHLEAGKHRLIMRQSVSAGPAPRPGDLLELHNTKPEQWHWFDTDGLRMANP